MKKSTKAGISALMGFLLPLIIGLVCCIEVDKGDINDFINLCRNHFSGILWICIGCAAMFGSFAWSTADEAERDKKERMLTDLMLEHFEKELQEKEKNNNAD
ncbi:MAG: hypothetical protein J1E02_02070 [Coprobacter sp.]|nr:hypothetical protein [Coprobacter sp.]